MSTVLLVGEDDLLQQTRAAVLHTIGADTLCSDPVSALAVQADRQCDLVVLCHTLSEPVSNTLAEAIHSHWPGTRILLMTSSRIWESAQAASAVDAISAADPERLIQRAVELLGRRPPRSVRPPHTASSSIPA